MKCARSRCFGLAGVGALCNRCEDLKSSAIVVAVCFVISGLIICGMKLARTL